MESKLARILKCRFSPVALTRTDSRPENALSFRPGRRKRPHGSGTPDGGGDAEEKPRVR